MLGTLLGRRPDWFSAGEIRYLWQRGLIERRLCGCGLPVPECPVWTQALAAAVGDSGLLEAPTIVDHLDRLSSPALIARALRTHRPPPAGQLGTLPDTLTRLYRGLRDVTGSAVIVDTSKPPTYGWLLDTLPDIDLYTVHLVRDPRAVAFSWQRRKPARDQTDGTLLARKQPAASAVHWTAWNSVADRLGHRRPDRYLRLRYEDLVADPDGTVERIAALVDTPGVADVRSTDEPTADDVNHAVAGNPSRFERGDITISIDREWETGLAARDRHIVEAICAPLTTRYGYPLYTRPDRTTTQEMR